MRRFSQILGQKQKKGLHLKNCANFHEFRGETTKKKDFYYKICKKTVLAYEFWGDNQYLGSLRLRTALQWHRACYFLWGTILAWGQSSCLEGTSSDLGARLRNASPWRRACCKFRTIYRTVTIAFSLKRYCSKSVLLKK